MATITAVVTTYNAGALVEEAVASILAQTRVPDEIIVIDDGSTDDTSDRLATYGPRVQHHLQANAGSSAARNAGWKLARSEWIAFLDADDLWMPRRLEQQEAWLAENPGIEAVFGLIQNFIQPGCEDVIDAVNNHVGEWLPGWTPGTVLMRRETLERIAGFRAELRSAEVIDWIIRLREAEVKMAMTEIEALGRRLHRANKGLGDSGGKSSLRILRDFIARNKVKAAPPQAAP